MPASAAPRLCRVAGRDPWHIYHNRRRISTGTTDRAEAARFLVDFVAELDRPAAPSGATIAHILDRYLADRQARGKPGAERLRWAHKPLARLIGDTVPEAITDAAARDYAAKRAAEGVQPGTARTELQALRAALRWAAGSGKLSGAAPKIELPPRPPARQRWLTRDEAARLLAECKARHVRLFVLLALHTAARRGAILGLTWDRVDLARRVIDYRDPAEVVTRKRRVAVPITDTLARALAEAKDRASGPHVVEYAGERVASVKHGFRDAATRAGVAGATPHTLRHTAVTWMMQGGVDVWQVAGMAGMTVEMVQTVYGHHHPGHLAAAARALEGGLQQ